MNRPEQDFQITVATYLTTVLEPSLAWFTAFPAGGGGLLRGKILKAMGLKPGVGDLLVLYRQNATGENAFINVLFIELKAKDGRVSEAQKGCHLDLERVGATVRVCRNLNEVDTALVECNVPMRIKR